MSTKPGTFQKGNQAAAKEHTWREAILRAMSIRGGGDRVKALNELAAALLDKAAEGDISALKEIGDRLDGKAKQQVTLSGDENAPLIHRIERAIVDTAN